MTADGVERLWQQYATELPTWVAVGQVVASRLRCATRSRGILCAVTERTKEMDSLLRKAILKGRVDDLGEIRDKAGARTSTHFPEDAIEVASIIRAGSLFRVEKEDDKVAALGADRIGYLGIHFDILLTREDLPDGLPDVEGELWCEVQVHTAAQSLFAGVSHPLLYKTPTAPSPDVTRAINRLSALGEIFDHELATARSEIVTQAGYPAARLMFTLERHFLVLAGREGDPETNQLIVDALSPLYDEEPPDVVEAQLAAFVERRDERLRWVYSHYGDGTVPFVLQPASVLIFERLDADRFAVKDCWLEAGLPLSILEKVSAAWGTPVT